MALVDDDVREVVLRVVAEQEGRITAGAVDAERLVGGHVHAGVLCVVSAVGILVHLRSVVPEDSLHGLQSLRPQFVAIAQEQGAFEPPCVRDSLQ